MIRAILEGRPGLPPPPDLRATLLAAWRTNNRLTVHLIQRLPAALWDIAVPGVPQRTIRMIAAHLHNARCMWIKTLGREHGITAPTRVDHRRVARRQLVAALRRITAVRSSWWPVRRATAYRRRRRPGCGNGRRTRRRCLAARLA